MKNLIYLSLLLSLSFISCEDVDVDIIPIVGVYEANILGVTGPFSLSISSDGGDDVLIEAPFDGDNWEVIKADIDDTEDEIKNIDLFSTEVADHVYIDGEGFYSNNTIQLDYEVIIDGNSTSYTIVATKL